MYRRLTATWPPSSSTSFEKAQRDLRHPLTRPLQQGQHQAAEELSPPRQQEEEAE